MNILFYSALPAARHGGVVRWMQQISATLRGMGHRVHILAWSSRSAALPPSGSPDEWGPDLHRVPVDPRLARLPLLRFWGPLLVAARAGRRAIEEHSIQVVHCVAVYEAFSALLARGGSRAAVVLSVHGDFIGEMAQRRSSRLRRRLYRSAERRAFRGCDAITTSSQWLRGRLAAPIGSTPCAVIPNGIALPGREAPLPARAALGLPEGRPIVLTVNNLYAPYRRRGLALLVEAAPAILAQVPDVLFVVAGGVNIPQRDEASLHWARELTRGLPFHFTGYRARSPVDLMAACDLYLHASALDNSPTALLEAMALGRPIVATAVGGIPELIADQETGLLVPLDAGALASATIRLLADRAFAGLLGRRAHQCAESDFSWARCGERFAALYRELLRSRGLPEEALG